ncbi:MAG TPA: glycosyltransferase, partial [Mycobacterium sp.]|nr:glycosyltransferase [Mycobacterium sp.]
MMADCLRTVPMSRPNTGAVTLAALSDTGVHVSLVSTLVDVDTVDDIDVVRRACRPGGRFARVTLAAGV